MSAPTRRDDDLVVTDAGTEPRYVTEARARVTAADHAFAQVRTQAASGAASASAYGDAQTEIQLADLALNGALARWAEDKTAAEQGELVDALAGLASPELDAARAEVARAWSHLAPAVVTFLEAVETANKLGCDAFRRYEEAHGIWPAADAHDRARLHPHPWPEELSRVPRMSVVQARSTALGAVWGWLDARARAAGHDPVYRGAWIEGTVTSPALLEALYAVDVSVEQ